MKQFIIEVKTLKGAQTTEVVWAASNTFAIRQLLKRYGKTQFRVLKVRIGG